MKKAVLTVIIVSSLQLAGQEVSMQEEIEALELTACFKDCSVEGECLSGFDPFDALAEEDVLAGVSFEMEESMIPAWAKSLGIAVILKLIAVQELCLDQYEAFKKLLGITTNE